MDKRILISIPLQEFEEIQKKWIREIITENQPPPPEPEKLITRKEAAKILGISLPTLNEYSKNGTIPAHRIGSRVRYKRREILGALVSFQKYRRRD